MPARLTANSYGKSDVRVTKVIRRADRHDLVELSVDVALEGDFDATYLTGDNSAVVATDSMKNTVYALARDHALESIESFGIDLARHFVSQYAQVRAARVEVRQHLWARIGAHPHAFASAGNELRTCAVAASRSSTIVTAGLRDLLLLKTTDSAFAGFVRDEFTTLKETADRIFATSVTAAWRYASPDVDFNAAHASVRAALLETFASHVSLSVQQTLYAMGEAALAKCSQIGDIEITMPNKHRLLVNLAPLGRANDNEVFVWTDEPYGNIYGRIERS
jgi:urate oxidase